MLSRRLRVPTSLTVSLLGLGIASCDPTPQPDVMNTVNCDTVCRARSTVYLRNCTPVSNDAGGSMCSPADDASATFCAVASVVVATNGSCCCEPVA